MPFREREREREGGREGGREGERLGERGRRRQGKERKISAAEAKNQTYGKQCLAEMGVAKWNLLDKKINK